MNRAAAAEGSKRPVTLWTMLAALPHMLRYYVVRRGGGPWHRGRSRCSGRRWPPAHIVQPEQH